MRSAAYNVMYQLAIDIIESININDTLRLLHSHLLHSNDNSSHCCELRGWLRWIDAQPGPFANRAVPL